MNIVKNLNDLPYLKLIVVFNDLSRDELKTLDEFNSSIEIVSFRDLAVTIYKLNNIQSINNKTYI